MSNIILPQNREMSRFDRHVRRAILACMPVEYEWRFDENLSGERPGEADDRRRPRWRFWLGLTTAAVLLVALGLYGWWRVSRESLAQAERAVQAVARLEIRALADGDTDLYMSLQDGADPQWLDLQRTRLVSGTVLPPPAPGLLASDPLTTEHPLVIGGRARVEFVRMAGPPGGEQVPFRAVRFYRLAPDGRWLHTPADPKYAGRALVWVGTRNDLTGYIVENELLEQLAPELELTAAPFCGLFSCPPDVRFTLSFTGTLGVQATQAGVLPAPHIAGVPDDEAARSVWIQAVKGYLADIMLAQVIGEPVGGVTGVSLRVRVKEYIGAAQPGHPDLSLLAQAYAEERLLTPTTLWDDPVPDEQIVIAGQEAVLLADFIDQEYGREGVAALLSASVDAQSWDAAVQTALKTDRFAFEQRWMAYVQHRIEQGSTLPPAARFRDLLLLHLVPQRLYLGQRCDVGYPGHKCA